MGKLGMIKGAISLVAGLGVGNIVDNGIKMIQPKQMGSLQKMVTKVGGFALSMFVADKVTDHIEEVWTKTKNNIKKFVSKSEKEEVIEIIEEETE